MRSARTRPRPITCLSVSVTLTLATLLSACDSGDDEKRVADSGDAASSATTITVTSVTTTAPGTPESAVLDAYRRYWAAVNSYGAEEKPFDPAEFQARFSPIATGAQYDSLFERFQLNRAEGLVYRGGESDQLRPRIVELADDRAVIEDCADDTGGIFSTRDNVFTADTTPGQQSLIRAVLRLDAGAWKVSTQDGGDERCTP